MISRLLRNLIGFAGQEGFIHGNLAFCHDSVGADLIAGGEDNNIIQHQVFRRYHLRLAIPDSTNFRRVEDGELFQCFLGIQLLNNSYQGIGNDNRKKCQVPKGTYDLSLIHI